MAALVLVAVLAFSTAFYQQFYMPKLLAFFGMVVVSTLWIVQRRDLTLPDSRIMLFLVLLVVAGALFGFSSTAPLTSFVLWAYYLGAVLVYVALLQFGKPDIDYLLKVLFFAALAQLPLAVLQHWHLSALLPGALIGTHGRLFGTAGNQEFMATLLGAGFFIGMHMREGTADRNKRILLTGALAALLGGLALADNKGGLLFVGAYFLWRRIPRPWLLLALAVPALVLGGLLFPDSVYGRILLWLASALVYLRHPLAGVGYFQLENNYLDAVRELFGSYPLLKSALEGHTAMALDAHNLFLQFAAELGTAGLVLALLFARHVWRTARRGEPYLGTALLFMLFKSMYTVVLPSITGILVFLLLLARLTPVSPVREIVPRRFYALAAIPVLLACAVAILPALSDHYYQRGARALFMGRAGEAQQALHRALLLNRENADASLALAQSSFRAQDYPAMSEQLRQALYYRKNKDVYKIAAAMYYYAKRYDRAFDLYQYLHSAFPLHRTSLTKLSCIYMIRGDYDLAYVTAQQALHVSPRTRAASDARNLRIARQVVVDSYPHVSAAIRSRQKKGES